MILAALLANSMEERPKILIHFLVKLVRSRNFITVQKVQQLSALFLEHLICFQI